MSPSATTNLSKCPKPDMKLRLRRGGHGAGGTNLRQHQGSLRPTPSRGLATHFRVSKQFSRAHDRHSTMFPRAAPQAPDVPKGMPTSVGLVSWEARQRFGMGVGQPALQQRIELCGESHDGPLSITLSACQANLGQAPKGCGLLQRLPAVPIFVIILLLGINLALWASTATRIEDTGTMRRDETRAAPV